MVNSLTADAGSARVSDADVEQPWKAFRVFDADGSGAVSTEELAGVMLLFLSSSILRPRGRAL